MAMASEELSLSGLPPDVERRILHGLDWTTIARLACVSRHFSAKVAGVQVAPVWRTQLTQEKPSADGGAEQLRRLVDKLRFPARPDLCIVFCSRHWIGSNGHDRHWLHQLLRGQLPASCSIVVCSTDTLIGRAGSAPPEEHDKPSCALSVSLLHLPPGAHLDIYTTQAAHVSMETDIPLACLKLFPQPQLLLVLTRREGRDPVHEVRDAKRFKLQLELVRQHPPDAHIAGAVLDSPHMSASLASAHFPPGGRGRTNPTSQDADTVVLSFHGPAVDACALTVHGLEPQPSCHHIEAVTAPGKIGGRSGGEVSLITDVTPGRLVPLDAQPGWCFAPAPDQPGSSREHMRRFATHYRLVGQFAGSTRELLTLPPDKAAVFGGGSGDLRHGAAMTKLAAIPTAEETVVQSSRPLAPGTVVTSAFLEPPQSRKDCATALALAQQRLGAPAAETQAVTGCFMFSALSRGRGFYEAESVEARMVDAAFPGMPIAGSFAVSQVGPAPVGEAGCGERGDRLLGDTRLLQHTTVLAFLRLRGPPV